MVLCKKMESFKGEWTWCQWCHWARSTTSSFIGLMFDHVTLFKPCWIIFLLCAVPVKDHSTNNRNQKSILSFITLTLAHHDSNASTVFNITQLTAPANECYVLWDLYPPVDKLGIQVKNNSSLLLQLKSLTLPYLMWIKRRRKIVGDTILIFICILSWCPIQL